MSRHRRNVVHAGRGFADLFAGARTTAAVAAGARLATFIEYQILYFESLGGPKRGR